MKKFLSSHSHKASSLAKMLVETHQAATTKVSDWRLQVEELWQAAGEMLPRTKPTRLIRHVEKTLKALKNRDTITFPRLLVGREPR